MKRIAPSSLHFQACIALVRSIAILVCAAVYTAAGHRAILEKIVIVPSGKSRGQKREGALMMMAVATTITTWKKEMKAMTCGVDVEENCRSEK